MCRGGSELDNAARDIGNSKCEASGAALPGVSACGRMLLLFRINKKWRKRGIMTHPRKYTTSFPYLFPHASAWVGTVQTNSIAHAAEIGDVLRSSEVVPRCSLVADHGLACVNSYYVLTILRRDPTPAGDPRLDARHPGKSHSLARVQLDFTFQQSTKTCHSINLPAFQAAICAVQQRYQQQPATIRQRLKCRTQKQQQQQQLEPSALAILVNPCRRRCHPPLDSPKQPTPESFQDCGNCPTTRPARSTTRATNS